MNKENKYNIIYADPAWDVMAGSKQSRKDGDSQKSLPLTYKTMTLDEIKALPVKEIKDKNCVLFLWTINKYLEQSYEVARAWGFKPSTMLVWDKTPKGIGLGGTFTLANEYLLFCRSGIVKAEQRVKGNHWHFPREKHSKKPDFFRNLITDTFGDLNRIELFARQKYDGWDAWGNEVDCDVNLMALQKPKSEGEKIKTLAGCLLNERTEPLIIPRVSNSVICDNPHCIDGVVDEIYGEKLYCDKCGSK